MYLPVSTPRPSLRTTKLEDWSSELWDSALMATELALTETLPWVPGSLGPMVIVFSISTFLV